jgi:transcriptional regulator with XRE-family HTH domain
MSIEATVEQGARTGVFSEVVREVEARGGLTGPDIAYAADVSNPTVSRWRNGQASPHPKHERVLSDLRYVVDRLNEYYEPAEVRVWLNAPHPQLEGARAMDVIRAGRVMEVLAIIRRLDDAAYL